MGRSKVPEIIFWVCLVIGALGILQALTGCGPSKLEERWDACTECCSQVKGLDESAQCFWVCKEWASIQNAGKSVISPRCEEFRQAGQRRVVRP